MKSLYMILIIGLSGCAGAQGMSKADGSNYAQEQAEIKAEKERRAKWVHRFHKEHPAAMIHKTPVPSGEIKPKPPVNPLDVVKIPESNHMSPRVIVNYSETNNFYYGAKK